MSENLRKRLPGPASKNFVPNTVLKAADLNEAFEGLHWEAALRAAAPNAPGLFRPWWCAECDETVNLIALTKSRKQVEISSLFLMTGDGQPIHVHSARVPLNKGQCLYLTPEDGVARTGSNVPEGAIPLARKVSGSTLMIEAEVATIDATPAIAARHREAIDTAVVWREALFAQSTSAMDNLANALSALAMVPRVSKRERRCRYAGSISFSSRRRTCPYRMRCRPASFVRAPRHGAKRETRSS